MFISSLKKLPIAGRMDFFTRRQPVISEPSDAVRTGLFLTTEDYLGPINENVKTGPSGLKKHRGPLVSKTVCQDWTDAFPVLLRSGPFPNFTRKTGPRPIGPVLDIGPIRPFTDLPHNAGQRVLRVRTKRRRRRNRAK